MPARSYLLVSIVGLVAVLSTSRSVDPDLLPPNSQPSLPAILPEFKQPPLVVSRSLGAIQGDTNNLLSSWSYMPYNDQTTVCWNNFNNYIDEREKNDQCLKLDACCRRLYYVLDYIKAVEESTDCDVNETLKQNRQHAINDRQTQCNQYNTHFCFIFGEPIHCSCDPNSNDCNST